MAETGAAASPVTLWRPKATVTEAVRWDGTAEVIAVLKEWGAEPLRWAIIGEAAFGVRVWGSRDGYAGALPGDWLVRDRQGAARHSPEAFGAAFEAAGA